jgi:hypothetical protein
VFNAYCHEQRSLDEISRTYRLSPHQVQQIVADVEAQLGQTRGAGVMPLGLESAVEDLGLSVRTRNALRSIGCDTVEDVLRLDLSSSVRGLGRKTKEELLTKLGKAGFHHPAHDEQPVSEMRILESSLERMLSRMDEALRTVAKEIRLVRLRLRRRKAARNAKSARTLSDDSASPSSDNSHSGARSTASPE